MPNPVFSEVDTFEISISKRPFSKHDYFLIKGNIGNKQELRNVIDKFVKSNANKECGKYGNYLMFFYKESSGVNEEAIQNMEISYRYKIFLWNKEEDYIASFDCWNSIPSEKIDFQPKYKN